MKYGSGIEATRIGGDAVGVRAEPVGEPVEVSASSVKRLVDLILAVPTLIFISPVLVLIAIAVKLSGPGPVIFRQTRIGANGRTFECLKFRSMRPDAPQRLERMLANDTAAAAEWRDFQKLRHDPRVTPVGGFLRRTSLDELPQLLNILRGEMSVIGPRPVTSGEIHRYGANFHFYKAARPGVLGLWQVSGRNRLTYEQRVAMDVEYVRTWTIWSDLRIALKAVPALLFGGGAY